MTSIKLGIGTVQFGMNYGLFNLYGKPTIHEVESILSEAYKGGVRIIDTASSYGDSEEVLGKCMKADQPFKIISKTPYVNSQKITHKDILNVKAAFYSSLEKLNQSSIYGILIHNPNDLLKENGKFLFKALQELKEEKLVEKIGVSVYTGGQIEHLLTQFDLDIIQIPINVFDQRLILGGYLKRMKEKNIEIHARSVFLQGLLVKNKQNIKPYFYKIKDKIEEYHEFIHSYGLSPIQAALGFLNQLEEIDHIIVGVETVKQLKENILMLNSAWPGCDMSRFAISDESIINPVNWEI
ncbi:aldo/keto reductase [Metabacillus bambusae]|uniref:Aldo/keto reductase n=1 Tax=Metabacillus bambusae TaxID=2795218 RepID=A0ABS3N533_9BACI|nr:aldo/keto reductase [Metabacillus bambusae]MBO1513357.1 aldo/keto reductase [Metabacillus bambusae]